MVPPRLKTMAVKLERRKRRKAKRHAKAAPSA